MSWNPFTWATQHNMLIVPNEEERRKIYIIGRSDKLDTVIDELNMSIISRFFKPICKSQISICRNSLSRKI